MGDPLLVKICGITRPGDAEAAVAAGADLLGFVFVPGTPRAVTPEEVRWVRELRGVATVGVFRDQPLEWIMEVRRELDLDRVQLHGSEPDAWIGRLGSGVLRRVPVAGGVHWGRVERLGTLCLPLLDPGAGDGVAADPALARGRPEGVRFGLAGGLRPENVAAAVAAWRPALVDVSGGVEARPGVKDPDRVAAFVAAARAAAPGGGAR